MTQTCQRLFFALWPQDDVREALLAEYALQPDLRGQGRQLVASNLHMTLHFLGNIEEQNIPCLLQQARTVEVEPFDLELNRLGHFKKPKVVWIGCDRMPDRLKRLHQRLGKVLQNCDFAPEQRAYNPHVTMARKIFKAPLAETIKPVQWRVNHFVLVQSITHPEGVEYHVKASFPD